MLRAAVTSLKCPTPHLDKNYATFRYNSNDKNNKQTPWTESARELYRHITRRLSAKLVSIFVDGGNQVVSVMDSLRPYSRLSIP
jgi:hypothetical protein